MRKKKLLTVSIIILTGCTDSSTPNIINAEKENLSAFNNALEETRKQVTQELDEAYEIISNDIDILNKKYNTNEFSQLIEIPELTYPTKVLEVINKCNYTLDDVTVNTINDIISNDFIYDGTTCDYLDIALGE